MQTTGPDHDMTTAYIGKAVAHTLGMAVDFFRRVVLPVRRYPHILAWLVWSDADHRCNERSSFARDFLGAPDDHIADTTSLKFRVLFRRQLETARDEGTFDRTVWGILRRAFAAWTLDTQEIEGTNNSIRNAIRLAPNISWDLLSARVTASKWSTQVRSGTAQDRRAAERSFLQVCVENHKHTLDFMGSELGRQRFDMVDIACAEPALSAHDPSEWKLPMCDMKCATKFIVAIRSALGLNNLPFVASTGYVFIFKPVGCDAEA